MSEDLVDLALATTGGSQLWSTLRGLKIGLSVGGPIWAMKGWPPGKTFDQVVTLQWQESTSCSARSPGPASRWSSMPPPTASPC